MEILKAKETDIDDIERIYEHIHDEEENGRAVIGWIRNVYPVRRTAEDALSRNDLFVMKEKNEVVAAAIINQIQVEEYKYARWRVEAEDSEVMVLHCLAVEPSKKNKGYGKKIVAFYEDYARRCGCSSLRMDTNARNTRARKLYQKLGYEETGIVNKKIRTQICAYVNKSRKSPASIAKSNKQWVGTCLYQEGYKPLLINCEAVIWL